MRWRIYVSFESFCGVVWIYNLKSSTVLVLSSDLIRNKSIIFFNAGCFPGFDDHAHKYINSL